MTNREIARTLDRIADILQLKEENSFKVRAYRMAANSIYNLDEDIKVYYAKNRIAEIPGIGKTVSANIIEMLEKGSSDYYMNLIADIPEGLLDMLVLPGLGHKTVKLIYDHLGISNREDLLKAAQEQQIRKIPGLGAKTEYNIIKGMELINQNRGKATLGLSLPMAIEFRNYLADCPQVVQASIVGSVRRGKSIVGDIDILLCGYDFAVIKSWVIAYRGIKDLNRQEKDSIGGQLDYGINFEVILVHPDSYYAAVVWTTGSKSFRDQVFNGVDPSALIGLHSEQTVMQKLGLDYIPPEIREDTGEIELARQGNLPVLVSRQDVKGDLHMHSDWSDGGSSIEQMAESCRQMGYTYMAITDHSKSLPISGGLNEERLLAQGALVDEINTRLNGFKVLKGIEVDILKNGELDFSNDTLSKLDVVIASIHSHFKLDKEQQTERIIKAIKNPQVNIIGHLTGRLLNRRAPYEIDLPRILQAAAEHNVALEINSHPDRLDIDEFTARKAKDYGVKIAINSDAHHHNDLYMVDYGILTARRGWLQADDIINCRELSRLIKFLKE
ncbi:MAG: DNA polymerase/3'-5' exonuclease PolX [Syntrophomonadaceae bacterium]|nr:DNA polymerase/3'-5' exonuclease PolX [Syntrophomonadaceae bacterium]